MSSRNTTSSVDPESLTVDPRLLISGALPSVRPDSADTENVAATTVEEFLESIVKTLIEAMNTRRLDPSDPIYQIADKDFKIIPGPPFPREYVDLATFLSIMRWLSTECPDTHITVLDMKAHAWERKGTGEVFLNWEVEGNPAGVVRRSVAVIRFRKSGEEEGWKLYTMEVMDGMDVPTI